LKLFHYLPLIFLLSCGDSPLLNHSTLGDGIGRALENQTALSFTKLNMPFEITWQNGCPSLDNNCSFTISFANNTPDGAVFFSELWMPDMGHGSSPFDIIQTGPNEWQFSEVYFLMTGVWQLKLNMKLNDGSTDEVILTYRL
jgi:hypothetical protein